MGAAQGSPRSGLGPDSPPATCQGPPALLAAAPPGTCPAVTSHCAFPGRPGWPHHLSGQHELQGPHSAPGDRHPGLQSGALGAAVWASPVLTAGRPGRWAWSRRSVQGKGWHGWHRVTMGAVPSGRPGRHRQGLGPGPGLAEGRGEPAGGALMEGSFSRGRAGPGEAAVCPGPELKRAHGYAHTRTHMHMDTHACGDLCAHPHVYTCILVPTATPVHTPPTELAPRDSASA